MKCVQCSKIVKRPHAGSWEMFRICPECFDHKRCKDVNYGTIQLARETNPVDMYWNNLTKRFLREDWSFN